MGITPSAITFHQRSQVLEVTFDDAEPFSMSAEYLRVHSPSAEVQGHGPGQEVLVTGKRNVRIVAVEPVGNYAVKLIFDDGHDTGLYSWETLFELGMHNDRNWKIYQDRLVAAGASRDA